MEIINSKVSVYEIELDLKQWNKTNSNDVPGFYKSLSGAIGSLKEHKCMSGERGGFFNELRSGTNFAHVIEHVILALIHLADASGGEYTGWTRAKEGHTYTIHYSAPNFLTGRLAAILAVDLVKKLIKGESVDINNCIELLKHPRKFFTHEEHILTALPELEEPVGIIQEIEESSLPNVEPTERIILSEEQKASIALVLSDIRKHINYIVELWRKSFFEYSGNFGRSIVDKIELINIDKFLDLLIAEDYKGFFRGVRNISHVINSYRIPLHFVVHSIWLYKNNLFAFIIEEFEDRKESLNRAIKDFEDLFQVIHQNILEGFTVQPRQEEFNMLTELKEFRELRKKKGSILVVDDDEITRRVFRDILEYNGYRTILAEDGETALEIMHEKGNEIYLTILDLSLPGISGEEVYHSIRQLRPQMNVIISSGYRSKNELGDMLDGNNISFIGKPFTVEKFMDEIKLKLKSDIEFIETDFGKNKGDQR